MLVGYLNKIFHWAKGVHIILVIRETGVMRAGLNSLSHGLPQCGDIH